MDAVNAIASERELDVVLEKSSPGVFFHSDRVDITDPVIERLDADAPTRPAPSASP